MDPFILIFLIASIATSFAGIGLSAQTSKQNKELTEDTNETNLQIAQEANAAQAAESKNAYERSKAGNQVALMQQAGMSRAGAINALNNGGSYTPAPINTAQMQAPQYDSSGIREALSGLTGSMANVGQTDSLRKQVAMQTDKNNADVAYVKAQTDAINAEKIQKDYRFSMEQLTNDMREKATSIAYRVNAADYDTPESYVSALKSKCSADEQKLFDNSLFVNALNATHQLNQSSSATAANIRNTDKDTELKGSQITLTQEQVKKTQAEVRKIGVDIDLERINKLIAQVDYHYKSDTVQYKIRAEKAKDLRDVALATLEKMRSDDYRRAYESFSQETRDVMNEYKLFCEYYSHLDPRELQDKSFNIAWRKMRNLEQLFRPTVNR